MLVSIGKRWLVELIALLCGGLGCARGGGDALVIATSWPEAGQQALEAEFRRWSEATGAVPGGPGSIVWIRLDPGDEFTRAVERNPTFDMLVGEPASLYQRLARAGRLSPIERPGLPLWCTVRRSAVGLAVNRAVLEAHGVQVPDAGVGLSGRALRGLVALDDPRHDPLGLALARRRLGSGDWAVEYAELVRGAGNALPIGRRSGSALASVERGEAGVAPAVFEGSAQAGSITIVPISDWPAWVEGAALLRGAQHSDAAQLFLRFLSERAGSEPQPTLAEDDPSADALLADLLGATLVDAQDELRQAWAALARGGGDRFRRQERERWLAQAPPWPPASVETMRNSGEPGPWVETLAEQLAPDPAARAWLVQSWRTSPRPIDGAFFSELAGAVEGRLAREPRFRAWLRAEWREWARQRYQAAARPQEVPSP